MRDHAAIYFVEDGIDLLNLGRTFAVQDHEVSLISPQYVRPHLKAQKSCTGLASDWCWRGLPCSTTCAPSCSNGPLLCPMGGYS